MTTIDPALGNVPPPEGLEKETVVLGICGASNGGKTTLAKELLRCCPRVATVIHQDDFYKNDEQVPTNEDGEKLWDEVAAVDVEVLVKAVKEATSVTSLQQNASGKELLGDQSQSEALAKHLVIVEGTMLLSMRELRPLLDVVYFITLDHDTMQDRRSKRDYGEPLPPDYFDQYVWPAYMRDMKVACGAHHDGTVRMLDGEKDISESVKEVMNLLEARFNFTTC